jgi:hypothetical protein
MFTKPNTGQPPPLLIMTYTYLDADNHNSPTLENKIFLIRMVMEKTKQNKGCWAELRTFKTSKLQYSRPDKRVKQNSKAEQGCYPMSNRK